MISSIKSSKSFERLIKKYNDASYRDKDGNTLAHLSALYNHMDHFKACEGDYKKVNHYGLTPVELAILLGRHEVKQKESFSGLEIYLTKEKRFELFDKDQILKHFKFQYSDHLTFKNPRFLKWTTRKCHKVLKDISNKWKNHWTVCMHEKEHIAHKHPKVFVKWIDPIVGYGLFAKEDIAQYSYVGSYTGVVKRRQSKKDLSNDYIFGYVCGPLETPFVIDAQYQGNFTRFINHNDSPNLNSTWMISKGICHIILYATQFIPKGSQLTYDYGPYYWKKRSSPLEL